VYAPALLVKDVDNLPVTVHLFERTVPMSFSHRTGARYEPRTLRLQLQFALKVPNGGKLNSHLWFMMGMCRQMSPEYIMLIDGACAAAGAVALLRPCWTAREGVGR